MSGPVLDIESIAGGGDGVGRLADGRVAFVPRTAPGDRVRVETVKDGGRWIRARAVEFEALSGERRDPPCPLYDDCGGCQIQHLDYPAQLVAKSRIVADALRHLGDRDIEPPEIEPSPSEWHYRNRVTFTLRRLRGGRVVAGFHQRERPSRILDVDGRCLLPEAPILRAWTALRRSWGSGANRLPEGGELRLVLRTADEGVVLGIDGASGGDPWTLVEEVPDLVAVWWREPDDPWRLAAGEADTTELWFGERLPVGAGAFVQVNRGAAEQLHRSVMGEVGPDAELAGMTVIDAYAGLGAYGRRLAAAGARVTAIELDAEAAGAAAQGDPEGFRMIHGAVEEHLAGLLPADRLILNPPRTGLDEAVPEILRQAPPARTIYVSCDPATLARDLARLGEGFHITRVRCFDLFPQTAHVETVVTLDHESPSTDPE